ADYPPYTLVTPGVDRHVAFGVDSHRAVADVRGADAQPFVIDDHHFRVQVDAGAVVESFDMRAIGMEMAIPVHRAELAYEMGAQQAHRHLLEPAMTQLAGDEHDLGSVRLGKAHGQRLRDP